MSPEVARWAGKEANWLVDIMIDKIVGTRRFVHWAVAPSRSLYLIISEQKFPVLKDLAWG